jgi:hypothetical protein
MTNATDFLNSNFFKGEGIEPNVRIETTIASWRSREFDDGIKLVVYTDYQAKGVVFNQTKLTTMIDAYGPNLDNWIGKPIVISRGVTQYAGKDVACVVVEPVVAARIAAEPRRPRPVITSGKPPTPPEPPPVREYNGPSDGGDPDDDIPW